MPMGGRNMFEFLKEMEVQKTAGDVVALKLDEVISFNQQIFKPYEGGRLEEMIESVRSYGIITPIIVRDIGEKYEILSGHNRVIAARAVGLESVPGLIRLNVSDEEARFIVTESNINQRGFMELSIIERAHCIAIRYEAMKSQGIRRDMLREIDTLNPDLEEDYDSGEILAESFDLSARNVRRYVRIHELDSSVKGLIEDGLVGMTSGVELSYLRSKNQIIVAEVASENRVKVSIKDAQELRNLDEASGFTRQKVEEILLLLDESIKMSVSLSREILDKYFKGCDEDEIYEVLERALELWFSKSGIAS